MEEQEVKEVIETAPDAETGESSTPEPEGEETTPQETPETQENRVQKRIDELTYKRREAERERDYWREAAMRQQPEKAPSQPQTQGYPDLPEPKSEDFDTYDQFVDARADWRTKVNLRQYLDQQTNQSIQTAKKNWNDQGRSKFTDWDEVFNHDGVPITDTMGKAIMDSSAGHELAYYLGKNLNEAAKIAGLPAHRQAYELGKLEVKLSGPPQKTKTSAPASTAPVGGKEVPAKKPDDMTLAEYTAWRESGGGR